MPHENKKTTSKKAHFWSNDIFSLYFKISHQKTTRFSAPLPVSAYTKSSLQFDFMNHSMTIMKMCEQI